MQFRELLEAAPNYVEISIYTWTLGKFRRLDLKGKTPCSRPQSVTVDYLKKKYLHLHDLYVRRMETPEKNLLVVYLQNSEP